RANSLGRSRSTASYAVAKMWLAISIPASAGRRRRASAIAKRPLGFDGAPGNGPKPAITTLMAFFRMILSKTGSHFSGSCAREHRRDLLHGGGWRQPAGGNVGFNPRQAGF